VKASFDNYLPAALLLFASGVLLFDGGFIILFASGVVIIRHCYY
jgi:hypothetical protein